MDRGRGEAGFSMVEALIAMAILVIAIIPLFSAINYGYKTVIFGKHAYVGAALLQRDAEEAKNTPYDNLASRTVDDFGSDLNTWGYRLERTVTDVASMTNSQGVPVVKQVVVKITRGERTLTRTTFIIHKKGF